MCASSNPRHTPLTASFGGLLPCYRTFSVNCFAPDLLNGIRHRLYAFISNANYSVSLIYYSFVVNIDCSINTHIAYKLLIVTDNDKRSTIRF